MNGTAFSGVRAKWLPLYEQLKAMTAEAVGSFDERVTSAAVQWRHGSAFAELSTKKDCMVVAFASDTLHDEWEPSKTQQTSAHRVAHFFEVTDDHLFPALIERIAAAYALTKPEHPRSAPPEMPDYTTVDEYVALFPAEMQDMLQKLRETIREAAPGAQEKISWQMPTYHLKQNLVHFAVNKNHIGFYPSPSGVEAFADRLAGYKTIKGGIQFPLSEPIPYQLIGDITRFRVKEASDANKED